MTQINLDAPVLQLVEQGREEEQNFCFLWGAQSEPITETIVDFDITAEHEQPTVLH